ncbi:hypothetical protein CKAH01_11048 [Colletotrichum kahawae]|uniref:Uncharacterized protein n=1 Tax=Colletotrichum kahawae TaxID=34407 RepID=A0AAD9XVV5_COLKA|nr:hypothetical protein CKAH01_11048 [Colletotrichum kahawae]
MGARRYGQGAMPEAQTIQSSEKYAVRRQNAAAYPESSPARISSEAAAAAAAAADKKRIDHMRAHDVTFRRIRPNPLSVSLHMEGQTMSQAPTRFLTHLLPTAIPASFAVTRGRAEVASPFGDHHCAALPDMRETNLLFCG